MLKQSILLLLVVLNINLNGSESYLSHIWKFTPLRRHEDDVSGEKVAAVLRDPRTLKLFEAVDRLLSVLPEKKSAHKCMCCNPGEYDDIRLSQLSSGVFLSTPWAGCTINLDICKCSEALKHSGLKVIQRNFLGMLEGITIKSVDGDDLLLKNLSDRDRCVVFAAWQQYQLPEERAVRERWSSARRAWVGAAVRSCNARKPFEVVAAKFEE